MKFAKVKVTLMILAIVCASFLSYCRWHGQGKGIEVAMLIATIMGSIAAIFGLLMVVGYSGRC
jgi:phosphatidylglycerophosphate synthase